MPMVCGNFGKANPGRWRYSTPFGLTIRCVRLVHYTGSDWRLVQPWILLTNYHRYVDQFIQWGLEQLRSGGPYTRLHLPGNVSVDANCRRTRPRR